MVGRCLPHKDDSQQGGPSTSCPSSFTYNLLPPILLLHLPSQNISRLFHILEKVHSTNDHITKPSSENLRMGSTISPHHRVRKGNVSYY
mmetsp:Transcript_2965/g.6594  ORF Transcript_2965/g.6594 Transcript_2965/m.6594 type:complete len:89 (-) Transcript_2965:831-1097(-)